MIAKDKIKVVSINEGNAGKIKKRVGQPSKYKDPVQIDFKTERYLKEKAKEIYGKKLPDMFNKWLTEIVNDKTVTY
jgi:hypothetical protein